MYFYLDKYLGTELLGHGWGRCVFRFIRNYQSFSKVVVPLRFLSKYTSFPALHACLRLAASYNSSHSDGCVVVSHCGFKFSLVYHFKASFLLLTHKPLKGTIFCMFHSCSIPAPTQRVAHGREAGSIHQMRSSPLGPRGFSGSLPI